MSGHSKWSTIKHGKAITDARRGKLFTKLAKEIIVAVRQGSSDPEMNVRLRIAIQKARDNNVPGSNIERAVKKGSGEGTGVGPKADTCPSSVLANTKPPAMASDHALPRTSADHTFFPDRRSKAATWPSAPPMRRSPAPTNA